MTTRSRVLSALAGLIFATAPVLPAGAASAESPGSGEDSPDVTTTAVQMVLDCAGMDEETLAYAVEQEYCTADGAAVDPAPGTQDVRFGNCGWSHLFVWDESGSSGRMVAGYGFLSIVGTVVYRNLTIGWTNVSLGTVGSSRDSGLMFSVSYANNRTLTTGNGRLFATLSGTVTLAWGGRCTLLIPSDTTTVLPG